MAVKEENKQNKEMAFFAKSRYLRISPFKLRLVADMIRNKYIDDADSILKTCTKRGAPMILKTLKSAVSNATYSSRQSRILINVPSLKITKINIDGGPMIKRVRPSSERRPYLIRKRFAHLFIELREIPGQNKKEIKTAKEGARSKVDSKTEDIEINKVENKEQVAVKKSKQKDNVKAQEQKK
ncbi:MAG: 50S ribosomal protein L22 [Planctomycetes bacterium]|nr:50S ribosomal protein L22 [Planctomycetota bacterium]